MILPDEDRSKLSAPPEPTTERWEEPDEHIDYLDAFSDEPENEP
jgi:hypothetical protein